MKLYSGPLSLFTAKVRVALAEKGLDYERIDVGWSLADRYIPHHPEVVALNPKAEVPVLVDGDLCVYDSTLILEYLEDRYPEPPLYPREPGEKARCRQLEAAADEIVFPHLWVLIDQGLYPADAEGRDEAALAAAREGLAEQHAALDKQLTARDTLLSEFSVADIGTYIVLAAAALLGAPIDARFENLTRWFERTGERPSLDDEFRAMQAYLAKALAAR